MAETPRKGSQGHVPRDARMEADSEEPVSPRDAGALDDAPDLREEDGWSQPESSAQKGAERDEG